ncbi:MAG TPA: hypothetical protein VHA37_09095, partial [Candidatus Saccharimonadales bacterium]|nr:hypothetical protein [Candidatus Saccharimonadales bacterium]
MSKDTSKSEVAAPAVAKVPWNPWLGVVFVLAVYYASQLISGLLLAAYPALRHWSHAQTVD